MHPNQSLKVRKVIQLNGRHCDSPVVITYLEWTGVSKTRRLFNSWAVVEIEIGDAVHAMSHVIIVQLKRGVVRKPEDAKGERVDLTMMMKRRVKTGIPFFCFRRG